MMRAPKEDVLMNIEKAMNEALKADFPGVKLEHKRVPRMHHEVHRIGEVMEALADIQALMDAKLAMIEMAARDLREVL